MIISETEKPTIIRGHHHFFEYTGPSIQSCAAECVRRGLKFVSATRTGYMVQGPPAPAKNPFISDKTPPSYFAIDDTSVEGSVSKKRGHVVREVRSDMTQKVIKGFVWDVKGAETKEATAKRLQAEKDAETARQVAGIVKVMEADGELFMEPSL